MSKLQSHHRLPPDSAPSGDAEVSATNAAAARVAQECGTRKAIMSMMAQLMYLCRNTQTHRGLSMGLLAGNNNFAQPLAQLQQQMQRRISFVFALSQQSPDQLATGDLNKITHAWGAIHAGWHDDSVLENFQFHSHFIEQLLMMVTNLSHSLKTPIHVYANANFSDSGVKSSHSLPLPNESRKHYLQLLKFICCQVPKMVEYLGMIRALSTHTATIGHNNIDHDKKLKYFSQCLRTEKTQVMMVAEGLYQYVGKSMSSLLVMKTHEFKLDAFIEKIHSQVIGMAHIDLDSNELFVAATNIMDVYWRVVDDGLVLLQRMHEEQVEQWCLGHT